MRKTTLLTSLVLSLLIVDGALAQRDGRRRGRDRRPQREVELQHFTFETIDFEAKSLDAGEGRYGIYLPKSIAAAKEDRKYPLVLWLHGMNESYSRFQSGGGAEVLDELRGEDKIGDLIFVTVSAPRRTIYANGEPSGNIEDLVLKDTIEHVEANYPVAKERDRRAIMGVSAGGLGALALAFKHPDRFGSVATHSSAMFPPDPNKLEGRNRQRVEGMIERLGFGELVGNPIDPKKWAKYVPSAMVATMEKGSLENLRIYFDAGTDDRYGFGQPNVDFHAQLDDKGITHEFELVKGGGHSWSAGSIQAQLVKSLQFVDAGFRKADEDRDKKGDR